VEFVTALPEDDAPISLTRVERGEERFIESCRGDTDGVVINLRFDRPTHLGGLKAAALGRRMPFLIDLETWRLPFLSGPEDESFGSDVQTSVARSVRLPLDPYELLDREATAALVRATVTAQVGAALCFAPDFQFASLEDPWLEVNIACLRALRLLAPREPLAAWIHVTGAAMLEGILPYAAERYAHELPAGSTLALTVSDLRPDLEPAALATYFAALRAFRAAGLRVLCDRAAEVSIPAVAAYADGLMLGNRLYRTAPASPIFDTPFNPAIPLAYLDGERARRVPRDLARRRGERGVLGCRHAPGTCKAIDATPSRNIEVRLHAAHEMRESARRARRLGLKGLRAAWREAPQKHLRGFAQALELAEERSQEA
jgi:hypothetical protein